MLSIKACAIPDDTLLSAYRDRPSTYTDCYSVDIDRSVVLAEFVFAFYTTPVFRLERIILRYWAGRPSTDSQARRVAEGSIRSFAAWHTEHRTETQLLMSDFRRLTRSWFMVTPKEKKGQPGTLLQFGSAVVPAEDPRAGRLELGSAFRVLLGFHKLYSRVLLHATKLRLERLGK